MEIFRDGSWKTPQRGEVLVAGSWRRIVRGEVYAGGQWRSLFKFVSPLSVSAGNVQGSQSYFKPTRVTSSPSTATPTGGLAPYSYSWVVTSGFVTASSPSTASTTFSQVVGPYGQEFATAQVTCTDALGTTATATINITLTNDGGN